MGSRSLDKTFEIPDILIDDKNNTTYKKLRFFGKVTYTEQVQLVSFVLEHFYRHSKGHTISLAFL